MTTLTKAQTALLTEAAASDGGAIDALQDAKPAKPLVKAGLLISLPKSGGGSQLLITDAGRIAIGLAPEAPTDPTPAAAAKAPAPAAKPAEPKGKLGELVALLKRSEGASLDAMVAATGWQAHSVRGAMSGAMKKRLGLVITSAKAEAGRIYHIANDVTSADQNAYGGE